MRKLSQGKKTLLLIVLILFIFISPLTVARAHAWDGIIANLMLIAIETVLKTIEQAIVAILKTVGATVITQLSTKLVTGGGNGKSMVITDWTSYLKTGPTQIGKVAVGDFLSQATRGKGSSGMYRPAPGTQGIKPGAYNPGVGAYNNYSAIATERAKSKTVAAAQPRMTMEKSPADVFSEGNMKDQDEMFTGINSGVALDIEAAEAESIAAGDAREIAKLEATSPGVTGLKDENGNVIAPPSVVSGILSDTLNLGNNMLASASNIPAVLTALATKLVTETFTKGLGNLSAKVGKEVTGVKGQSNAQVKVQIGNRGPAAVYKKR